MICHYRINYQSPNIVLSTFPFLSFSVHAFSPTKTLKEIRNYALKESLWVSLSGSLPVITMPAWRIELITSLTVRCEMTRRILTNE